MKEDKTILLLRITTVPLSLKHLLSGQLRAIRDRGIEVIAVSAPGAEIKDQSIDGVPHISVPMTRKITPVKDLLSLIRLTILFLRLRPDIVHTHTPKAGLLGMIAAYISGVPVRLHTVAGLPLMEKRGTLRRILIGVEKVTYACATRVFPNSKGLLNFIRENIDSGSKYEIIGKGSSNGIDTTHFRRTEVLESEASQIRTRYGIASNDFVFSFVGRVVRDKGMVELVNSFKRCRNHEGSSRRLRLIVVGPLEQDLDPLPSETLAFLREDPDVIMAGYQSDVRPWIMASQLFVFPSYREGFPNVVMQACCLGVPCVVSDINGCNEIISSGTSGLIVPPKDEDALFHAMISLLEDKAERLRFAENARTHVVANFDQTMIWNELEARYRKTIAEFRGRKSRGGFYGSVLKPFLDKLVAVVVLTVFSPLLLLCMALLYRANQGKVWFIQQRPGKNGKLFYLIKFKTMNDAKDMNGQLLPDEFRLHGIGKFIRKTSLDELPQLFNVLKGEMSIVGPRPLLVEYLSLYNNEQMRRHDVTPGITGWAQVNGRNAISWEQKFAYDVWYVQHQSFSLDLKILFMTVLKVFKAEGISSATSVTMEKFRGTSYPHGDHEDERRFPG